ncbi:alpha/beta hydrolase [Flavobacterium sp. ANB]|uniref:alpha/beta fold hydrolase n=1 Tax=unclassified Flavobacterium TaxID=196869 RepID=UPI0012B6C826|nr:MULTISPECIES: alpha/beta hydrolase [unclassified Flavobacterium]MBF4518638.1 alpha/beta hydrolase [Flavobacterium sp. ANB]MTD67856.1 alpha/beta fold hydrolase [Flavobacterium sp. LC2016-13]
METEKNNTQNELNSSSSNSKNTIVIVHGAWSSANDWHHVAGHLASAESDLIIVNLPGHGSDQTPVSNISLQLYVYEVLKAIGNATDVTLVGHSFGGIVVSEVAELIAPQIKKLIYIAAFVPKNGDSLLSLAQMDSESLVGKNLIVDELAGVAAINKESITDVFLADAPKPVAEYVTNNLRPEPLAPLSTPVRLTDVNFGQIIKVYIHSQNDHTIGYSLQQKMVQDAGILRTYSLPSSHTPFVVFPQILSAIIALESN